jgi:hypothetical protein
MIVIGWENLNEIYCWPLIDETTQKAYKNKTTVPVIDIGEYSEKYWQR